ncbi:hypothetical protein ILYODFUR_023040 [Ilyodon furcidens]|uniref:Uncharacterized protein n=1 Tax=Ilyodon furcidens TaxID=33524 RepID=A0ABV0UJH5_9TELE
MQIREAIPPDHASPGVTVVSHVGVEVPQQNKSPRGGQYPAQENRRRAPRRRPCRGYSALPPGPYAKMTVRDLSPTRRCRDETISSTGVNPNTRRLSWGATSKPTTARRLSPQATPE